MKLLLLLLLMNVTSGSFKPDLGFLFQVGSKMIPQKAELTVYSFSYEFEAKKFQIQSGQLKEIKEVLKTGSAFNPLAVRALPIPQLAKSITNIVTSCEDLISDLEELTEQKYTYGRPSAVNDTINVVTDIWYVETVFSDIFKLSKSIQNNQNHNFSKEFSTDDKAKEMLNNMVLLHNEIFKYYTQMMEIIKLLTGAQQGKLSEKSKMTLDQHIFETPEDSVVDSMEITYYNSGDQTIEFEIKVIVLGELEEFLMYKSVPYMHFKVNRTYYSDTAHTRLFSLECINGICSELQEDDCGKSLFEKDLDDILINCPFSYENAQYEITTSGIFIYSTPPEDLQALLEKHDLTPENFPALVQFSDCYNLKQGNVLVSGCIDLPAKQLTSRYDQTTVEAYFNPFFLMMIWNYLKNGPFIATILILPASLFLCLCGVSTCCKRMFRSKPKYKRVHNPQHSGRTNRIGRTSRRSNRSNRSTRSSQ